MSEERRGAGEQEIPKQQWTEDDWQTFRDGPKPTEDQSMLGIVQAPDGGTLATDQFCKWAIQRCKELNLPYKYTPKE